MPSFDLPPWILSALLAPFGLVVGSFCNVLIHRLPQEEPADRDVVKKPSHCPSCKTPIKPWHNLPLFGWLWFRGRCAACGWRIPVRYPLVELLCGLVWAGSVWIFPFGTLIWAKGLICLTALLVLFFTDFTEFILPDVLQFPLMALGVAFTLPQMFFPERLVTIAQRGSFEFLRVDLWANALQPAPAWTTMGATVDLKASLIGLVAGYGLPFLFERTYVFSRNLMGRGFGWQPIEAGMGMGDFKMLAWLGAFWGWAPMLGILGISAFLGVFLGIPLAMAAFVKEHPRVLRILRVLGRPTEGALCDRIRTRLMNRMIPFGCFIALATPLTVFYGSALWMAWWEYAGLAR